jgi:putative hemolysin
MSKVFWEIIFVFILTLLNGFFAMSEIALISVRKTRINALAKEGNKRAKLVQYLQQTPETLFATTQIGISVITIVASAFAGSNLAEEFSKYLSVVKISFISQHSYSISFILVVAALSYVSLAIGELIPKSLGLRYAETFSLIAAYPIWAMSEISALPIRFLTFTSNLVLRFFKDSTSFTEARLSEEEIRSMLYEGRKAGTIEPHEHNIIENVFDFSDLGVDKIMVPRTSMTVFDGSKPTIEIVHKAIESGYSRIPIYHGSVNNITGVLYTKRLLANFDKGNTNLNLQDFLVPTYFVPSTMKISEVLQRLQRKRAHMAMVTGEHGEVEGLVTMEDLLEEIVGDITDETDEAEKGVRLENGMTVVDGKLSIVDFNKHFNSELSENEDYNTVSGLILDKLGRFAKPGDIVSEGTIKLTVKEVTLRIVKTAVVEKIT